MKSLKTGSESFLKELAGNIFHLIEKSGKPFGDEISKILSEKFSIHTPPKNVLKLNEKFRFINEKLNKDKKALIVNEERK